ncbi:MAG: hypothetical protein RL607_247 [Bacteroidota bacterium]|jgi:hypothetical protein
MKKIVLEILIFTLFVLCVSIGLTFVWGKEIFSDHSIPFNRGESQHVVSLYFVILPLTFVLLSLFTFLRTALKKFQSNFLNGYLLTTTFISILCFPMAFELHQSLISTSVGKMYNSYYLFLQLLYSLFVLNLIYISYQIGKNKATTHRSD